MSAFCAAGERIEATAGDRVCEACGTMFVLRWATSEQRFCSRKCARTGATSVTRRAWTDNEVGDLLSMAHLSAREAALVLDRTAQSVQHKRGQLRAGWSPEREFWTEDEIELVRRTPGLTARQVADQLPGRSPHGVARVRHRLSHAEGRSFSDGSRKSPFEVGPRRLLAKTCLGCGLLLGAGWFARNSRQWKSRCNACHAKQRGEQPPGSDEPSTYSRDGGASARASKARLQALTRERAHRHREPWIDADHEVLRDSTLTTFEKALRLGRTYSATHRAVAVNGYTSRVGVGDPVAGVWVIDNPNVPRGAA